MKTPCTAFRAIALLAAGVAALVGLAFALWATGTTTAVDGCDTTLAESANAGDDMIQVEDLNAYYNCGPDTWILVNQGGDTEECQQVLDVPPGWAPARLLLYGRLVYDHQAGETVVGVSQCPEPTPEPTEPPTPEPTEPPTPRPGVWECGTYGDLEPWPDAVVTLDPDSGLAGSSFEATLETNQEPNEYDDLDTEVLWAWDAEEQEGELIANGTVPVGQTSITLEATVPEHAPPVGDVVTVCWWYSLAETWFFKTAAFEVREPESSPTPEVTPEPTDTPTPGETPTPTPPDRERPDLTIVFTSETYGNEGRQLVVQARVRNLGPGRSTVTVVRARSLDAVWHGQEDVSGLDRGESEEVSIELEISEDVADQTHRFLITVDPEDDIEEEDEGNNSASREVRVPALPPDDDDGPLTLTLVLAIAAGVTIGGTVTIAGVTFTVRHTIKVRRRKRWQKEAKEDELPDTCKPCTHHCRKIQIELKLARRAITHLTLVAHDPASGKRTREGQVGGEAVEGLNEALKARRQREEREQVQRLVEPVASTLSQQIGEWLGDQAAPRDVSVAAHLKGGEVTFKFILYHCSTDNTWEKKDEWEKKFEDERDETVTTLRGLDPTKPAAPELTQRLMEFIERV